MTWTLKNAGTTKTLESWGLSADLVRRLGHCSEDSVVVSAPGLGPADAPLFAFESKCEIYRDAVLWFTGWAMGPVISGNSGDVRHSYKLVGPWYWLKQIIYGVTWKHWNGSAFDDITTTEVFLTYDDDGSRLSTGGTINRALEWANTVWAAGHSGAPLLTIGTLDPDLAVPSEQITDWTVAAVLTNMLGWHPGAVGFFDYSTSPPTFNVLERGSLTALNLDLDATSGARVASFAVRPRNDMQLAGVFLRFRSVGQVDGQDRVTVTEQAYPGTISATTPGILAGTFELTGYSRNVATCEIETAAIDAKHSTEATRLAWWKTKLPWLDSDQVSGLAIPTADVKFYDETGQELSSLSTYPNELVEGQIAPWLYVSGDKAVTQFVEVRAKASFSLLDAVEASVVLDEVQSEELSVRLTATNATTGQYWAVESEDAGESVPTGMAQYIYEQNDHLPYDGSVAVVGTTSENWTLGYGLNLLNGATAWETMLASIYAITEEPHFQRVSLEFGPRAGLDAASLVSLCRQSRGRSVRQSPKIQTTGIDASSGSVMLGKRMPKENSVSKAAAKKAVRVHDAGGTGPLLELDAALGQIKVSTLDAGTEQAGTVTIKQSEASGKTVKLRQWAVCVGDPPVTKYALFLSSDAYDTPV